MAITQEIYRPNGIMVATDYANTAAAAYASLQSVVPDSAEHDVGKECIFMHWVRFYIARPSILSILAAATSDTIAFGWRAGLFASTAIMAAQKWQFRRWFMKVGATTGMIAPSADGIFFDYRDEPIVADPLGNTFQMDVSSSGASVFDVLSNALTVEYAYSWQKAGPSELNAYLKWESLGL